MYKRNRMNPKASNARSMGRALFAIGAAALLWTGCVIHVDPHDEDRDDRKTFSSSKLEGSTWKRTITVENRIEYEVYEFKGSGRADHYLLVTENAKPHDKVSWDYSYKDYSGALSRSAGAGNTETHNFTVDPNGKKLTFNDDASRAYHLEKD